MAFVSNDMTQCVASCGGNQPWTARRNNDSICSTSACTILDYCVCDFYDGYANVAGVCTYCLDTYVNYQRGCANAAICASDEVALGRQCIKMTQCLAQNYAIGVSGKTCVAACVATSEVKSAANTCGCATNYKTSKDGFACVRSGLQGGAIAGIVIACVVVVAVAVGLTVYCVMRKQGKCGAKKADKSKKDMKDTVTNNNDTALATANPANK